MINILILIILLLQENELFDNYMQQDAHEFLNYLLNTIADILTEEKRREKHQQNLQTSDGHQASAIRQPAAMKKEGNFISERV